MLWDFYILLVVIYYIIFLHIIFWNTFIKADSKIYSVWKVEVRNFAHERDVYDYVQEFYSEIHNWCWGSTRSGEWKFAISVRLKEESYDCLIEFCRFLPVPKICSRNTGISKRVLACMYVVSCGAIANTLWRSRDIPLAECICLGKYVGIIMVQPTLIIPRNQVYDKQW